MPCGHWTSLNAEAQAIVDARGGTFRVTDVATMPGEFKEDIEKAIETWGPAIMAQTVAVKLAYTHTVERAPEIYVFDVTAIGAEGPVEGAPPLRVSVTDGTWVVPGK